MELYVISQYIRGTLLISPVRHRLSGNSVKIKTDSNNTTMVANIFMGLLYDTLCAEISYVVSDTHNNPIKLLPNTLAVLQVRKQTY